MSIKDMPCFTVEEVLALRKEAIELEKQELGYIQSLRKLEAENTKLREAIKTHKDSFIGDEEQGDICTEDDRLWAALEKNDG